MAGRGTLWGKFTTGVTDMRSGWRSPSFWAGVLVVLAVLGARAVAYFVFEDLPHLEDEFAYRWQAQVLAHGQLSIPSPPAAPYVLVPFVVDYQGRRFGKYPLGWPVVLALAERLGAPRWANAGLAGLTVWLTYRLGQRLWGRRVGLLAAALTLTSPFFWVNEGSLLSHPLALVFSAALALAWLDVVAPRPVPAARLAPWVAGGSLAALLLTRPWTAVGVALPFGVWGAWRVWHGPQEIRRRMALVGVVAALGVGLHFLWQYALTGDFFRNPYTLWWPYDRVGFGPEVGRYGHTLLRAWANLLRSLQAGVADLFGWGRYSWLFLPLGFWAARRRPQSWAVLAVFPALVLVYLAYWVGAWLFGPRYYFEGLYSLTLATALGVARLAGWPLDDRPLPRRKGLARWRGPLAVGLLAWLVAVNLVWYLPPRLQGLRGLYDIHAARLAPFRTLEAQALTPAVVLVHTPHWMPYANLLVLEDPWLSTPFIFAWCEDWDEAWEVMRAYPDRTPVWYDPARPWVLTVVRTR